MSDAQTLARVIVWRNRLRDTPAAELASAARLVLVMLSTFMDGEGRGACVSIEQLAEATALSRSTVKRALAQALSCGWISRSQALRESGGRAWRLSAYDAEFPGGEGDTLRARGGFTMNPTEATARVHREPSPARRGSTVSPAPREVGSPGTHPSDEVGSNRPRGGFTMNPFLDLREEKRFKSAQSRSPKTEEPGADAVAFERFLGELPRGAATCTERLREQGFGKAAAIVEAMGGASRINLTTPASRLQSLWPTFRRLWHESGPDGPPRAARKAGTPASPARITIRQDHQGPMPLSAFVAEPLLQEQRSHGGVRDGDDAVRRVDRDGPATRGEGAQTQRRSGRVVSDFAGQGGGDPRPLADQSAAGDGAR